VVEKKNRTLVECARSMIKGKNLPSVFLDEVISTTMYLRNKSPTKFLEHGTPCEAFYGYKPIVKHFRIFGSKEFSNILKEDRRKLDTNSIKCVFISCCVDHRAYKMYDPTTHNFFASRRSKRR